MKNCLTENDFFSLLYITKEASCWAFRLETDQNADALFGYLNSLIGFMDYYSHKPFWAYKILMYLLLEIMSSGPKTLTCMSPLVTCLIFKGLQDGHSLVTRIPQKTVQEIPKGSQLAYKTTSFHSTHSLAKDFLLHLHSC